MPFGDEKPHGMPFEAGPLSPSHVGGERKRKSCGATSDTKVPTRGFSAKKEGVWRELSSKGADSRIFGEKEVVWRDLSAIFHSRIFGEKGNCVARPPEILYSFVYQYRLNAP